MSRRWTAILLAIASPAFAAEMRSLDMPKWLLLGAMPVGFGLMGIQFARFVFGPDTLHTGEAGVHE